MQKTKDKALPPASLLLHTKDNIAKKRHSEGREKHYWSKHIIVLIFKLVHCVLSSFFKKKCSHVP